MRETPIDPELPILDELGQALHEGALATERRLVERQLTERQSTERQLTEHQLTERRSTEHRRARRGRIAHGGSRMRLVFARLLRRPLLVLPLLVVLGGGAVALAASGVLRSGSAVPATPHLTPGARLGVPLAGRSRLIPQSVPDPAGGPPWSMRVVHTSRDFLCMQVGRLYGAQLGVIGEDGAFDDDRRFHPLPPSAISEIPGRFLSTCEPSNLTSTLEVSGMPASAELPGAETLGKPSEERRLYFGLLGPDAVSVTYRQRGRAVTAPVQPGTGAYLIVLPGARPAPRSVADGGRVAYGRLVPGGVLTEFTYRLGRGVCVERAITSPRGPKACPHRNASAPAVKPRDLHRAIHVSLRAIHRDDRVLAPSGEARGHTPSPRVVSRVAYEAIVAFRAPFAVRSALSDYSVEVPDCRGGAEARALERNIRAGELVRARVLVFANECRARMTFEVHYHASASVLPSPREETLVGTAIVRKPPGVAIVREPPAAGRAPRAR